MVIYTENISSGVNAESEVLIMARHRLTMTNLNGDFKVSSLWGSSTKPLGNSRCVVFQYYPPVMAMSVPLKMAMEKVIFHGVMVMLIYQRV